MGVRLGGVERTAGRGRVRAIGRRSCESCACAAQCGAVARPDARTEYMYGSVRATAGVVTKLSCEKNTKRG